MSSSPVPATNPFAKLLHDLRNVLQLVLAHCDLAREALPPDHPAFRELESAKKVARGAAGLIHEFTQPERPRPVPHKNDAVHSEMTSAQIHASQVLTSSGPGRMDLGDQQSTILIVEDEALIRESSLAFLSGAGFRVLEAASGEEAVLALECHSTPVDLLITDVALPQMSGTELAKWVASSHPETKILAISGHPEEWVLGHPETPIKHFLAKPFSFSELHSRISELLAVKKPARGVSAL